MQYICISFSFRMLHTLRPVSYTHLDVYKRQELEYIEEAVRENKICGDGAFTKKCSAWMEQELHTKYSLLTTSCTPVSYTHLDVYKRQRLLPVYPVTIQDLIAQMKACLLTSPIQRR